jgi:hypothetical protein
MADDSAILKQWVETWELAGVELDKVRRQELAAMTDDDVRAAIKSVMGLTGQAWRRPEEAQTSGLIEQQRYFSNALHQRRP